MMKIVVKSLDFHADSKLVTYIEQKVSRLNRYFDKTILAEVHLKLQDTGGKIRDKQVEIRLHIPGNDLIDKKMGKSFETALTASVETLKRQLLRHKGKISAHPRGVRLPDIVAPEEVGIDMIE